ncbi:MAG: hypothetical protein WAV38_14635 [Xanthobacteraceae bacterium]
MERREEREREEWRRLVEAFEWLEDHCWVLPKEERAKAKPPARSPLTADELRRLIPGAPDTALAALVLKAQLIAHPKHWRPRLVVNNPRVDASSSKLTAHQLREAIRLGVKLAEEEALFQIDDESQASRRARSPAAAPNLRSGSNRAATSMSGKFVPPVEFADDAQIKHSKTASMLNPRMFRRPIFFRYSSSTRSPPAGAGSARAIFPVPPGWPGVEAMVSSMRPAQIQSPRSTVH